MTEVLIDRADERLGETVSIADLLLKANRELAQSDARIYRSVDRHLMRTREILSNAQDKLDSNLLTEAPDNLLIGEPSYDRQTRRSLENLCRVHAIRGYSRMTKEKMISRLSEEGVPPPPTPLDAFTKSELLSLLQVAVRRHYPQ